MHTIPRPIRRGDMQDALVQSADRMSEKRSANARSAGEGIRFIK